MSKNRLKTDRAWGVLSNSEKSRWLLSRSLSDTSIASVMLDPSYIRDHVEEVRTGFEFLLNSNYYLRVFRR